MTSESTIIGDSQPFRATAALPAAVGFVRATSSVASKNRDVHATSAQKTYKNLKLLHKPYVHWGKLITRE
jgi:hypothetical protein